jgi:hypothetical protein
LKTVHDAVVQKDGHPLAFSPFRNRSVEKGSVSL